MTKSPSAQSAAAIYATLHRYSVTPTLDSVRDILPENFVDLTVEHLVLLHAADTFPNGGLYCGPWLQEAARRYSNMWLPLLAHTPEHLRQFLTPPLDIAYVWYLHRLNAQSYQSYCLTTFGTTLQPSPCQAFNFAPSDPVQKLWGELYGKSEPLYPPKPRDTIAAQGAVSVLKENGFDVEAVASIQASYLQHYLRACYLDPEFLEQACQRYCKYLMLCCNFPGLALAPHSDIDLMWRTHICILSTIAVPCSHVLRQVITYDPSLHSIPDHPSLRSAFKRTRAMWSVQFPGESLVLPGSDFVSSTSRHPVETRMHDELSYFAAESQEPGALCDGPRAGAHALYLQWLHATARQHEEDKENKKRGVLKSLFRDKRNMAERRTRADFRHRTAIAQFHTFRNLPHDREHAYWKALANYHLHKSDVDTGVIVGTPRSHKGRDPFATDVPRLRKGVDPYAGKYFIAKEDGEWVAGRMRLEWVTTDGYISDSESKDDGEDVVFDRDMSFSDHFAVDHFPMAA